MTGTPRGQDASTASPQDAAIARAPALSLVAALGGWLALLVSKVSLPALSGTTDHEALLALSNWGEFGSNLAAVSGIPSLVLGLSPFMQPNAYMHWPRRGLVGAFALLVTTMTMWATFFERAQTSKEVVIFGLGAAHVLTVLIITSTLPNAAIRIHRLMVLALATMGMFGLLGHVVELLARNGRQVWFDPRAVHNVGEVGYLATLMLIAFAMLKQAQDKHEAVARFSGFLLLGVFLAIFSMTNRSLGADFGLILYHAQHVRLLLDVSPLLYGLPLCLVPAMGFGMLLSSSPLQRQLGIGSLLLVAGGYSPRSPGQLLMMALAALLLARTIAATAATQNSAG